MHLKHSNFCFKRDIFYFKFRNDVWKKENEKNVQLFSLIFWVMSNASISEQKFKKSNLGIYLDLLQISLIKAALKEP